jgi:putative acetyltransferase
MTIIRPERTEDVEAIDAVHSAGFSTDAEARLVRLLRKAGRLTASLVAEVDGAVVGHVAFSPVAAAAAPGAEGAGLAPIAVLPDHRRRGIASRLVEAGLSASRGAGFGWAVVLGDPAFYSRFGFRPAGGLGLSDEYGGGDAFQAMELIPGALPIGSGLVCYAPEFASLEE